MDGKRIYEVDLEPLPEGAARVAAVRLTAVPDHYTGDDAQAVSMLEWLLDRLCGDA
jgi:hypothetical protein